MQLWPENSQRLRTRWQEGGIDTYPGRPDDLGQKSLIGFEPARGRLRDGGRRVGLGKALDLGSRQGDGRLGGGGRGRR